MQQALTALVAKPAGCRPLLRQRTRFDARALAPLLTGTAKDLLARDPAVALKVIAAFTLTDLEPSVAALPATASVLTTLRQFGSTRANLFLPLTKSPDPALRDAALAALVTTPARLLPLWPELSAGSVAVPWKPSPPNPLPPRRWSPRCRMAALPRTNSTDRWWTGSRPC